MEIQKAQWTTDGDTFTINMPMTKIDKENRLVSGWASLDNPDLQGDIVTSDASERAFARFRGNIREMHQPIAVGRMVSYRPDSYYDETTQKMYRGIFVTARVSKGAQDTWEKVIDGTLQAFSIKGPILDSEQIFEKSSGKTLRKVNDYDLEELSLVDSGGNQLANIISIQKSADGDSVTGTVTKSKSANVFYCARDKVAKTSTEETEQCFEGHRMENIGWIEYDDDNLTQKVEEVVVKHNSTQNAEQDSPATNEGGVNVAEKDTKVEGVNVGSTVPEENGTVAAGQAESEAASSVEAQVADNEEVKAEDEDTQVEKAADVSEVEVEEPDFAKMFGDLQTALTNALEKSSNSTQESLSKATEGFAEQVKSVEDKVAELTSKFDSLVTEVDGVKKSVEAVENETAVKKSGDLGGSAEETLVKQNDKGSKWGGFFLGTSSIE